MIQWIDVKCKLPDKLIPVLAWDTQRIYLCYRPVDLEYNEHWTICLESDCVCNGCTGAITHWIPLPNPPEDS